MSLKMHQLYPNFHSLISAPSQPLDPRIRRRSLVWTRPLAEVPNQMNLSLNPAIYSMPQTTMMTRPLRRRSTSQAPFPLSFSMNQENTGGSRTPISEDQRSPPTPPPPPSPPFPFRDGDSESLCTDVEECRRMRRMMATCIKRNRSQIYTDDERVKQDVKSAGSIPTAEEMLNPASHISPPGSLPYKTTSLSHVFCQSLTPSLPLNLPSRKKNVSGPSKPTMEAFANGHHVQEINSQVSEQNLSPQVYDPTICIIDPISLPQPVDSTATPVACRRVTPGRQRLHCSESLRRRTLVDVVVPTDWLLKRDGCQFVPKSKGPSLITDGGELHCSGNCQSSDSGVDVCETESVLAASPAHGFLGSTPIGAVVRRSCNPRRAHVVSVFEENLTKMSQRLQAMTQTTSKKDSDLHDLRNTIDLLRSQSGLLRQQTDCSEVTLMSNIATEKEFKPEVVDGSKHSLESDGKAASGGGSKRNGWLRQSIGKAFRKKPTSQPVVASTKGSNSLELTIEHDSVYRVAAHSPSITSPSDSAPYHEGAGNRMRSTDVIQTKLKSGDLSPSNSSITSASSSWSSRSRASATSATGGVPRKQGVGVLDHDPEDRDRQPKVVERTNTLRHQTDHQPPSDCSRGTLSDTSLPSHQEAVCTLLPSSNSNATTELHRLHQMLTEREMKLTDVQLQALARAHQIDDLSEQMNQLYAEVRFLRADNERLQAALSQQQQKQRQDQNQYNESDSRVGVPIDDSKSGVNLQVHNSITSGINLVSSRSKVDSFSIIVSIGSLSADISQRHKGTCLASTGKLAIAFTNADNVKTWSELDTCLHWLLTQYIDRLGVRAFLGLTGHSLSWYSVEATSHGTRYRRNLKTVPTVTCKNTGQTEDLPSGLEFVEILQTLALTDNRQLSISLHLDDWLDELSLRCLLPKHWLGAIFNFLQTYGCLVFYSSKRDELRETAELFAAQLKMSGKVSRVYPVTLDQTGLTAVKLTELIHTCLVLGDDDGKSIVTGSQPVRLVTIDNLQLSKSASTLMETLDSIRATDKDAMSLSGRHTLYILANWLVEDAGGRSPGLELPAHTLPATPTVFCTGKQCCWVAVDRIAVATQEKPTADGLHRMDSQCLHQSLLNKVFTEAMQCLTAGQTDPGVAWSKMESAQKVASWLVELCLRLEELPARHDCLPRRPSTGAGLGRPNPAALLACWPALQAEDLGETWFLARWNDSIDPALLQPVSTPPTRSSAEMDNLIDWLVSTWPWHGIGRRLVRIQPGLCRLDLVPVG